MTIPKGPQILDHELRPKAVITLTENDDGDLHVSVEFDPELKTDEPMNQPTAVAFQFIEFLKELE